MMRYNGRRSASVPSNVPLSTLFTVHGTSRFVEWPVRISSLCGGDIFWQIFLVWSDDRLSRVPLWRVLMPEALLRHVYSVSMAYITFLTVTINPESPSKSVQSCQQFCLTRLLLPILTRQDRNYSSSSTGWCMKFVSSVGVFAASFLLMIRLTQYPSPLNSGDCAAVAQKFLATRTDIFGRSSKSRDRVDASKMPCRGANKSHIYLHSFV